MTTIRNQFSGGNFLFRRFGVLNGSFVVQQFPNVPCSMARLKTHSGNAGSFFLGTQNNTGTTVMPWEMDGGDDTGWFAIDNLNRLYYSGASGTTDRLAYWIEG